MASTELAALRRAVEAQVKTLESKRIVTPSTTLEPRTETR